MWLFYVQHQFEDTYWQSSDGWSYADAALRGSSYLKLPKVLQFFTGNIGLHHVHHLSAKHPELQPAARARREPDLPRRADALAVGRPARRAAEALGRGAGPAGDLRGGARAEPRLGRGLADRDDLEFTYSLIDRIFRLSLGELADFSGAKYDGDFSLTLEEAQRRKHEYVAEQIGIGPGRRVLDLGCGWGPLLDFVRAPRRHRRRRDALVRAGGGLPAPRSRRPPPRRAQVDAARPSAPSTPWPASARSSTSARPRSTRAGRQDDVYRDLFARIASVLPDGGRFYLQTMVFGRNMIPLDEIDIDAPRDSDAWYLALMGRQFPGSCLPFGQEQIVRSAEPHFRLVSSASGRLDYIETIRQWRAAVRARRASGRRCSSSGSLPRWLTSADFRLAFTSGVSANSVCFERELLDHYRLVFEKAS